MTDVLLPEQYLESLKRAIEEKKQELKDLEIAYAKISTALASPANEQQKDEEIKKMKIAGALREYHKGRRKKMADRIIAEIPNWKDCSRFYLAEKINATVDAINKIFEEDSRFKQ